MKETTVKIALPRYRHCFICGTENHKGLGASPFLEDNTVKIIFKPELAHSSLENITHGGIQAALLDEVLFWAATLLSRKICVTAEMNLRFLKPATLEQKIIIAARATKITRRVVEVAGKIENERGELLTRATAKFIASKNDLEELLQHTGEPEKFALSSYTLTISGDTWENDSD
jgi:uncharacterized protein (TIGR00369 family)